MNKMCVALYTFILKNKIKIDMISILITNHSNKNIKFDTFDTFIVQNINAYEQLG